MEGAGFFDFFKKTQPSVAPAPEPVIPTQKVVTVIISGTTKTTRYSNGLETSEQLPKAWGTPPMETGGAPKKKKNIRKTDDKKKKTVTPKKQK